MKRFIEQYRKGARRPCRSSARAVVILWIAVSLLCFCDASRADALDPADKVPGHPGVTYFDLVRQIVRDLDSLPAPGQTAAAPTAHDIVPYRHIEGADAKTDPSGPVAIQLLTALTIHADGKSQLALMIDLGPSDGAVAEFTLLGLFDTGGKSMGPPKLLDVVEVGTDRLTGFVDKPMPLRQSPQKASDLFVIDSDHFNSNEDFVGTEFLFVRDGRFRLAGSVFTFDAHLCTSRRTQTPSVTTRPYAGSPYRRIHLAVREKVTLEPDRAGCGDEKTPRSLVRIYHGAYRWNARQGKFVFASGDLKKLDRENEKLMSGDN